VTAEQVSAKSSASPTVLHSQIKLPTRLRRNVAIATEEEYECLWMKVNRIYEKYMKNDSEGKSD
jgi:hypothetical protein